MRRGASGTRFSALDGIDLEVPRGELLGIVGMNGSGKSTLLRLIAGISEPTQGEVVVNGSVGSLIEVGAGFHPELSGYENVYLNGTILGIPRSRINDLLPQIVEFAGLEGFMDMPVKHYSSGMYMRLGFAIAIQIRPDVLLLDETFAVGDAAFQSRALKAIEDFRVAGVTTLMVSHDVYTMRQFCDRVLWLDRGRARMLGDPFEVVEAYRDFMAERAGGRAAHGLLSTRGRDLYGEPRADDPPVTIASLQVLDDAGKPARVLERPEWITLSIAYSCRRPVDGVRLCVAMIRPEDGAVVIEKDSERENRDLGRLEGVGEIRLSFEATSFYSDSLEFIAAFYDPADCERVWARETVGFDLVAHEQPTPESFRYFLAPCRTYEHRASDAAEGACPQI
jgi:ABC-type polysaccharide/polyol phosphate transport system ATPase subunit